MNKQILKLDEMESDLVLACKSWYGEKGIEKVIADYCKYDVEHCDLDAKYHFISELFIKLVDTGHLKLTMFLNELSPRRMFLFEKVENPYDIPKGIYKEMVSMINNLKIQEQDKENNWYILIELHEAKEKFRDEECCKWCGIELNTDDDLNYNLCKNCNNKKLEAGE